jgi:cell division transport system permease protein
MIAAARYFVTEAAISLWRGRRSTLLSTLTITIAIAMLGVFLVLGENLDRMVADWSRSAELSVYLKDGASPVERDAVESALRASKAVSGVDTVSKDAALARFRRDFPDLAPATQGAPANPFPASFEARLASPTADASSLDALAKTLAAMAGVADVRYDRRWLDRLAELGRVVRWSGLTLSAILMLAAALTVTSVVRLALYARRDEVEIMELVGAPMAFIRGPFIAEGTIQGGVGALLALGLVRLGVDLARPRLAALTSGVVDVPSIQFLSWSAVGVLVLGGMVVGCLGGLVAARRLR